MTTGINNWSEDARPRERLLKNGARSLSTAELLAILIGSGTPKKDAVELMKEVLESCGNNLTSLARLTYEELTAFNGIGQAKAITILAALELARRKMETGIDMKQQLSSPDELYRFFYSRMCDLNREVFWVVLLDNHLRRLDDRCLTQGDVKGTVVEPRMVFNYVVTKQATAFAIAHNHPTGVTRPSKQDDHLTSRIHAVAKELGVKFIDHLIIGDGQDNYYSYAMEGKI